ncbi:MAG TPA: SDR family oxidoreductase [Candidatus Margulisiibacteriota bacterium]|nr:SDR family oxidoreductase [Candidatus Margulisiibacteriota bacterium]
MELSLDGKVAVVTGGSRGIGKAIAAAYAAAGARVMITARKAEALQRTAAEIGADVLWFAGHVGEPEAAAACIRTTLERCGRLDILVNNAGTNPYAGPLIDADLPRFDKTVQVNLRAPLIWTQQAWRQWMKDHGGVVINMSSVGGFVTASVLGLYNVTKAALIHMTKQLAAELGPKVRVNAIAPGLIRTDFAKLLWEGGRGEQVAQVYPLKRLGEPEDVAAAAVYLAADSSSWITGHTIVLDGGGLIAFPR